MPLTVSGQYNQREYVAGRLSIMPRSTMRLMVLLTWRFHFSLPATISGLFVSMNEQMDFKLACCVPSAAMAVLTAASSDVSFRRYDAVRLELKQQEHAAITRTLVEEYFSETDALRFTVVEVVELACAAGFTTTIGSFTVDRIDTLRAGKEDWLESD